MPINIANVTGSAQTGLTSPVYNVTADSLPANIVGKQVAVTSLGGTQAGVTTHSVSSPFTMSVIRPGNLRVVPAPDSRGIIRSVPFNNYKVFTRKGVIPAAGQVPIVMPIETKIPVPAGADAYDIVNVRAALSAHIGLLQQLSAELGNTCATGSL